MCRFILVKSKEKISSHEIHKAFAQMSRKSRALDDDWQGDGWGISYLDENNEWQIYKSLRPVWDEYELPITKDLPKTNIFTIHARSASFPSERDYIEFNQPFGNDDYTFVSNVKISKVRLSKPVAGKTGSQKLWNLLKKDLQNGEVEGLNNLQNFIKKVAGNIGALNIGVASKNSISALCLYGKNDIKPDYHKLVYSQTNDISIICSEPIEGFEFEGFENGEVKKFC